MNRPGVLFLGRTTLDVLYRLDRLPEEDTKVYADAMQAAPGGPAMNAALTHARLGGEALLVSAVGSGPWAAMVRAELDAHDVRLLDLAAGTGYETPLCTVLANSTAGTRTIVNPPVAHTALATLPASWEQAVPDAWGAMPKVILTDGFHLAESLPLLRTCKEAGAAICLDGGSWKPGTEELAGLLHVAICSERFALPGQNADAEATLAWLAGKDVAHLAVTRGANPILAWDRGRRFKIEIEKVDAVDTLGAGDVLHGAFTHFFAAGDDFEAALRKASQIATLSCRKMGTQGWTQELSRLAPAH